MRTMGRWGDRWSFVGEVSGVPRLVALLGVEWRRAGKGRGEEEAKCSCLLSRGPRHLRLSLFCSHFFDAALCQRILRDRSAARKYSPHNVERLYNLAISGHSPTSPSFISPHCSPKTPANPSRCRPTTVSPSGGFAFHDSSLGREGRRTSARSVSGCGASKEGRGDKQVRWRAVGAIPVIEAVAEWAGSPGRTVASCVPHQCEILESTTERKNAPSAPLAPSRPASVPAQTP